MSNIMSGLFWALKKFCLPWLEQLSDFPAQQAVSPTYFGMSGQRGVVILRQPISAHFWCFAPILRPLPHTTTSGNANSNAGGKLLVGWRCCYWVEVSGNNYCPTAICGLVVQPLPFPTLQAAGNKWKTLDCGCFLLIIQGSFFCCSLICGLQKACFAVGYREFEDHDQASIEQP